MKELTEQEKKEKVKDLRPIDDVFFEVLAQNKGVCEEILRTILEDEGLIVEDVIELYIVYISEFDFLKKDKTIYHIEKIIRETGEAVDDGLHEIFVNTTIDDGTDIAELMSCFTKKEVKNAKFPKLSAEVKRLKETEGGLKAVCEVMEKYENMAVNRERIDAVKRMIRKEYSKDDILGLDYTEEEYMEAERELSVVCS